MPQRPAPESPIARYRQIFFVGIVLPTMVALAWWKAPGFDPYTDSFLTKNYIAPTPEMPGELQMAGWVFVGIGALVGWVVVQGFRRRLDFWRDIAALLLVALQFAAIGGAFFVAADSAADAIAAHEGTS